MRGIIATVFVFTLPFQTSAAADGIHLCDELLALSDTQSLCRYYSPKRDANGHEIAQDFEFSGKLYENETLRDLPDGTYATRPPLSRSFRVENSHVMEETAVAFLSDTSLLRFYDTSLDGSAGQRVYQCDKALGDQWSCALSANGVYHDRGGSTIRVENGFLVDVHDVSLSACRLNRMNGKTSVDCENRD